MIPEEEIPCAQLSLVNSLHPAEHLNIGRALQNLNYENLLVTGSGFAFHDMKALFTTASRAMNEFFESWLLETYSNSEISKLKKERRFTQQITAPYARFCHPGEEHLLPLHVCYGFARTWCSEHFELLFLNIKSNRYLWSVAC
jgi:4,5-DOPA dioxygenase extradiol